MKTYLRKNIPQPILPVVTAPLPYEAMSRDIVLKKRTALLM